MSVYGKANMDMIIPETIPEEEVSEKIGKSGHIVIHPRDKARYCI